MSIITTVPSPNLWDQVCQEYQEEREQFHQDKKSRSTATSLVVDFDASKHHPALYGKPFTPIHSDYAVKTELDQSVTHPSCAGYWISDQDASSVSQDVSKPCPPDKKRCPNREFLEYYVWPSLLPAMEKMLAEAKRQGCFGLKKVPFNALDYLTEYLYNSNPMYHPEPSTGESSSRDKLPLMEIPFVQSWLQLHPRPPQPASLFWTEDETATKIQAAWRAYVVRKDPELQELHKWQEEWRFINRESQIQQEVSGFWERMMPDLTSTSEIKILKSHSQKKVHRKRKKTGTGDPPHAASSTGPSAADSPTSAHNRSK